MLADKATITTTTGLSYEVEVNNESYNPAINSYAYEKFFNKVTEALGMKKESTFDEVLAELEKRIK